LMENLVANNINDCYYWKDYQNHEVDFVVRKDETVLELIQVSYVSQTGEINNREIRSLLKASKALKCNNAKIITWDLDDEIKRDGLTIKLLPLFKFLLKR
ncbi:MAG: ATPase, partial [Patescibacteria group bacterium]|nr:ATPase [Patescibacteria group bacterium]